MSPEHGPQLNEVSPVRLLVARICVGLLLGMIFVALFGDFVVWAVYGTRFILSQRFHKLTPIILGFGVLLIYLFIWQSYQDWKQGKPHYILIGFFVLVIGGIPLARLVAAFVVKVTIFAPTVGVPKFYTSLFIPVLLLVFGFACKVLTLSKLWHIAVPVYKPQEQRRIAISD